MVRIEIGSIKTFQQEDRKRR